MVQLYLSVQVLFIAYPNLTGERADLDPRLHQRLVLKTVFYAEGQVERLRRFPMQFLFVHADASALESGVFNYVVGSVHICDVLKCLVTVSVKRKVIEADEGVDFWYFRLLKA